jgi:hypothetical protein
MRIIEKVLRRDAGEGSGFTFLPFDTITAFLHSYFPPLLLLPRSNVNEVQPDPSLSLTPPCAGPLWSHALARSLE